MLNTYLEYAKKLVYKAGSRVKGMTLSKVKYSKENDDLVTEADLIVNDYIIEKLLRKFPHHKVYSEEKHQQTNAKYLWILDPIDGTKYYARKIPLYAISLALQIDGELAIGIVYDPESEQMYYGSFDSHAMLNDIEINCSEEKNLGNCIVCVEIPSRHAPVTERNWAMEKLRVIIDTVQRARIIGVSSLGLSWCAKGGFDAYINLGSTSKIWDVAAGYVIIKKAGGVITYKEGKIVAGPLDLHNQLIDLLKLT